MPAASAVPAEFADLVGAPHFAHLVTVNPDGSPQSSPIWVRPGRVNDGGGVETVEFVTGPRYRKSLNMQREPRVALSIHAVDNPYRYLEVLGRAVLRPRTDWSQLDEISNTYLGTDYPYKGDSADGWLVSIEVERYTVSPDDGERPPLVDAPPAKSDLLSPPHFSHVATVSSQGQPRSSIVWHRRAAGGGENDIEFFTSAEALKTRHLRRNAAVAVSIHDEADPYRYVELRGTAEMTDVPDSQMLHELTPLYWQMDRFPMESGAGVVIRVNTTHRVG